MPEVTMINSVVSKEYDLVSGKTYDLPEEIADEYILKGYASGDVSRVFSEEEVAELKRTMQVVGA
jgi:hypothetical protein